MGILLLPINAVLIWQAFCIVLAVHVYYGRDLVGKHRNGIENNVTGLDDKFKRNV